MVQRTRVVNLTFGIFGRLLLLVVAFGVGLVFFQVQIHQFVVETLGYQNPPGFFDMASWAEWDISWNIATSFWIGIIFGTLGKKIDYIFIIALFLLFSLDSLYTGNMTWLVYSGLVGATILGNVIGLGLKLLRLRFLR